MRTFALWAMVAALFAAGSMVSAQEGGGAPPGGEKVKEKGGEKDKGGEKEKGKDVDRAKFTTTVRERVTAKAMEWAKGADADANGSLNEAEFGAFLEASRKGRHEIVVAVMAEFGIEKRDKGPKEEGGRKDENLKKWDTNGDGKLDDAEKEARKAAVEKEKQDRLTGAFKKADADSNGSVSFEEAVAFLTIHDGRRGGREKGKERGREKDKKPAE